MDNADFAKLSDADKKELQQFIIQENQNGLIQKNNRNSHRYMLEKVYHVTDI